MESHDRLEWEAVALEAGVEPEEVRARRELEEYVQDAAENLMDAVDRTRNLLCLSLEGVTLERAEEMAGCAEHRWGSRLEEFQAAMRASASLLARSEWFR